MEKNSYRLAVATQNLYYVLLNKPVYGCSDGFCA